MKVLIACEKSQTICRAFRERGHEAYSCDIVGVGLFGNSEWHITGDAVQVAYEGGWDLMIAHPPCTYMSNAGARWMYKGGKLNEERLQKARKAKDFFMKLYNAPIPRIAVENPQPLKVVELPPHTQDVQPYQFGDPFSKKTRLWLRNLPELKPTKILTNYTPFLQSGGKDAPLRESRSVTFTGIAKAMAEQWG